MSEIDGDHRPSIGIIGFGAFGRLMARHLRAHFRLYAFDPGLPEGEAALVEGAAVRSLAEVARCRIVVLAMPVSQLQSVVAEIGPCLRPGTLVLDVGSVKVGPTDIMWQGLPDHVEILGTHPLFGPESARNGIRGRKIALCPVRGRRWRRIAAFLRKVLGLRVIVTTPHAHDREAATVQGLTHLLAKVLVQMEPLPTRMTTASFDLLCQAVEMVRHDAPEVFLAIERANPYSREVRKRFFRLVTELDASLDAAPSGSASGR